MQNKNQWIELAKKWAGSTIFAIILIFTVRTFIFDWSVVPSGSMTRTFLTGDVVLTNKLAYGHSLASIPIIGVYFARDALVEDTKVKRGDIIVFCGRNGDYITKRVVGLPGDIIKWDHKDLQINGESTIFTSDGSYIYPESTKYKLTKSHHDLNIDEIFTERYGRIKVEGDTYRKVTLLFSDKDKELPMLTFQVPKGHVFVRGDNTYPEYSFDSRDHRFGDVCISRIIGNVSYRLIGSNAKVFNRKRSWVGTVVMLPYLALRYIMYLDITRFGRVEDKIEVIDRTAKVIKTSVS